MVNLDTFAVNRIPLRTPEVMTDVSAPRYELAGQGITIWQNNSGIDTGEWWKYT